MEEGTGRNRALQLVTEGRHSRRKPNKQDEDDRRETGIKQW